MNFSFSSGDERAQRQQEGEREKLQLLLGVGISIYMRDSPYTTVLPFGAGYRMPTVPRLANVTW